MQSSCRFVFICRFTDFCICIFWHSLYQDIPIPTFFQEKKEEDWTDEERRAAVEYQKKVKELEEEREKFRKVAHFSDVLQMLL